MNAAFIPKRASDALLANAAMADVAQLAAMFSKLDAYGKRVLLAQAAAMLRVQTGGK
jgi:hypothetical protein